MIRNLDYIVYYDNDNNGLIRILRGKYEGYVFSIPLLRIESKGRWLFKTKKLIIEYSIINDLDIPYSKSEFEREVIYPICKFEVTKFNEGKYVDRNIDYKKHSSK